MTGKPSKYQTYISVKIALIGVAGSSSRFGVWSANGRF